MNDQRVLTWPPLDFKDAAHGVGVEGISPEAVDGLGWKGDEASSAEPGNGKGDFFRAVRHEEP